ncbi:hypothetical protein ACMXZD_04265, partial [Pasteurella multocida]
ILLAIFTIKITCGNIQLSKRDTNKENRMEFNSVQELKEFVINEVLQAYADRAGKTLAEVRKLFESVDWVKEEVMDKVYEISLQIARN